jgi:hypothetical protein
LNGAPAEPEAAYRGGRRQRKGFDESDRRGKPTEAEPDGWAAAQTGYKVFGGQGFDMARDRAQSPHIQPDTGNRIEHCDGANR